jgi:ribosome biogenesis GTPase A
MRRTNAQSGLVCSKTIHLIIRAYAILGVSRDVTGRPNLQDYGRYATLMGSLQSLDSAKSRYPQLVSFIGVTNAGKSTVIKMLVNHMKSGEMAQRDFPTPVVGSVTNDKVRVPEVRCREGPLTLRE